MTWVCAVLYALLSTIPSHALAASSAVDRMNEYDQRLTAAADTVALARSRHDFIRMLCNRAAEAVAQDVTTQVRAWEERNAPFVKAATAAVNDVAERQRAAGGDEAPQRYLQMLSERWRQLAPMGAVLALGGTANFENDVSPPDAECSNFATWLRNQNGDFRSPLLREMTRPLDAYVK